MRPRAPRPSSSTARSPHSILETGGANGSERERYTQGAGEYGSAPGVTFIKGRVIKLDQAGPLYAAIEVGNLPYGRDRWIRWDQELTSTCPECARAWADHPGGIQLWAQDGHLGRVLPECPQGGASQVAGDDAEGS